ncbi:hypothetical protein [uncultured Clostridium sp.]|uniref:hypothetical protein n=1 Tax=uncultured Clostridium sp. TaxID=59620 RepID=UPI00261F315D|nr:hypothetical protein [uncultured Clostridium sp.]
MIGWLENSHKLVNIEDYDLLTKSLSEANKQNFQLLQDKVKLEGEIIDLKIDLQHYKKVAQDMSKF